MIKLNNRNNMAQNYRYRILKITRFQMLIFPVLLNLGSCNLKTIESIEFEKLSCDYYTNPVGLENQTPGF